MGSFDRNMAELAEKVGDGKITGRVSFSPDKIAVPQHEGTWKTGPLAGVQIRHWTTPGTGPGYLLDPLLESVESYFREIARDVLTTGPRFPIERAMDDLLSKAQRRIPKKTGELASSGRAEVSEEFAGVSA